MTNPSEMKNPTNLGGRVGSVSNFPKRGKATMNSLVKLDCNVQKMSSREIAELCNKRHDNVMADIRKMLADLGLATPEFSGVYKDQQLIDRPCFNLPKRETLILVSGYNIELRAKIIDRWAELEKQVAQPIFDISNPVHLLQAIEVQARQNIELTHKVEALEPKANALDTLANAEGTVTLDQAAKLLGVQPKKFLNPWLVEHGWCFRRSGDLNPHQDKVNKKYLIAVFRTFQRNSGEQHTAVQVRVTSLGMAQLAIELKKWQDKNNGETAA